MAQQRDVFDGDKVPQGFHETTVNDEAFFFYDYSDELDEVLADGLVSKNEIQRQKDAVQEMNDDLREQEIAEMNLTPAEIHDRDQKQLELLWQRIAERAVAKAARNKPDSRQGNPRPEDLLP